MPSQKSSSTITLIAIVLSCPATSFCEPPTDPRHIARIRLEDIPKLPPDLRAIVDDQIDPCAIDRDADGPRAVLLLDAQSITRIRSAQVPIEDRESLTSYVRRFAPAVTLAGKSIPSVEAIAPDLKAGTPRAELIDLCSSGATSIAPYNTFHTWEEGVCFINSLANAYPQIAQVVSIGTTIENRTIWALKISDNVTSNEPGEEKILFTGETHAREWGTHEMMLYMAEYLTTRYASDPQVARIVNNSVIWLVPVVNPDGYVYTWTTDRMWRKNRRNNPSTCEGVDINRNYNHRWGYDSSGSSTSECAETYRGTSGGSEPETQAIQNLLAQEHFAIGVSYHTYSQLVLFAWGYTTFVTPESYSSMRAISHKYADLVAATTGFPYIPGQGGYTIYLTNGDFTDYAYGAAGTMGFTPEMRPRSSDLGGFLLPEDQILHNDQENMAAALWLMDNVASVVSCSNPASSTLIENPQLGMTSYFALPVTPTHQKPAESLSFPGGMTALLEARLDDSLHQPPAWVSHASPEMEGCGAGSGYRFNVSNASALSWANSVSSYRALPFVFEDSAEVMVSNRNVGGLNVIGIPSAVRVRMSDISIIKRRMVPPTADFGYTEEILEQRTALQDAASISPWINWTWNWVDSSGVSHPSHPSGAGGADVYVHPFRAYQFTSNVQSWNFGSTSNNGAVYLLHFPGYSLDCNRNGVADPTDIALAASQDCNADGIPDECQSLNIAEFVEELLRPVANPLATCLYDLNFDGKVDGLDIQYVIDAILP